MTSFVHGTRPGADRPAPRTASRWFSALAVVVPAACIAGTFAVMLWAYSPGEVGRTAEDVVTSVLFFVWNLSPHLGLLALLVNLLRCYPRGFLVALVLALGYTGFTAWTLYDVVTSESSTAALVFIFLPVVLWGGVIAIGAIAWMAGAVAGRIGRHRFDTADPSRT